MERQFPSQKLVQEKSVLAERRRIIPVRAEIAEIAEIVEVMAITVVVITAVTDIDFDILLTI
jgi:hypothetical protein